MKEKNVGSSLLESFAQVPDHREPRGRRHPLPAILALATAAMLEGARSLYAIVQWGRLQEPEVVRALGFRRKTTPCVATLHLVFKELVRSETFQDATAFETALKDWAQGQLGDRKEAIAIDGKGLRGIHGEELPGVRLVAAYSDRAGLVLAPIGSGLAQSGGKEG
jgi:hypothetical protein